MSANWLRDKVNFDKDCKLTERQAEHVMKVLIIPNSWCLQTKDGTTPRLVGLQQQIDIWRLVAYLQK